jgi:hypothetical protein
VLDFSGLTLCTLVIAACIDRWALCSSNGTIRSLSRPHIACRVIVILILMWSMISIHLAVFSTNRSGRCSISPSYALAFSIYASIFIGIVPLFLLILFSLFAWRNLQFIRSRLSPMCATARRIRIYRRDRDLLKMLVAEVFVYSLTSLPYLINTIYTVATSPLATFKSPMRLAIESLVASIVSPILGFTYSCAQFYGMQSIGCRRISFLISIFQYMLFFLEVFDENFSV